MAPESSSTSASSSPSSSTPSSSRPSPRGLIAAALILGVCVLGAAILLSASVNRATVQLASMSASMQSVNDVIGAAAAGRAPNRQAGRTGPDPEKVYEVDTASSPAKGPEDAAVTLVAFSDFQCPFCARVTPTLAQVDEEYGSEVRIVFKHLPLSMHPKAPAAHAAAEAARLQGKFWEMHDLIFANQREMSEEKYVEYAGEIGLDVERFRRDVASPAVIAAVERDKQEAEALGVTGTPSFFVNGKFMSGAQPLSEFKARIEAELEG